MIILVSALGLTCTLVTFKYILTTTRARLFFAAMVLASATISIYFYFSTP